VREELDIEDVFFMKRRRSFEDEEDIDIKQKCVVFGSQGKNAHMSGR
jgi:hypothetical protein